MGMWSSGVSLPAAAYPCDMERGNKGNWGVRLTRQGRAGSENPASIPCSLHLPRSARPPFTFQDLCNGFQEVIPRLRRTGTRMRARIPLPDADRFVEIDFFPLWMP
jgi:hypothetical protein